MDEILKGIGEAIGQILNDPTVQTVFRLTVVYAVLIWLAAAYWAYRDLRTRTTNPLAPYGAAAAVILFTPIFFPLGVVLYRIVRPPETVAEASERALAEEAMLVEVEKQHHCGACKRPIEADWLICPNCRTRLRRVCSSCGRLVESDWLLCAYCGKDFERPEHAREALRLSGRAPGAVLPSGRPAVAVGESSRVRELPRSQGAPGERRMARPERAAFAADDATEQVPKPRTATRRT